MDGFFATVCICLAGDDSVCGATAACLILRDPPWCVFLTTMGLLCATVTNSIGPPVSGADSSRVVVGGLKADKSKAWNNREPSNAMCK